jgi:hypothetical protein
MEEIERQVGFLREKGKDFEKKVKMIERELGKDLDLLALIMNFREIIERDWQTGNFEGYPYYTMWLNMLIKLSKALSEIDADDLEIETPDEESLRKIIQDEMKGGYGFRYFKMYFPQLIWHTRLLQIALEKKIRQKGGEIIKNK